MDLGTDFVGNVNDVDKKFASNNNDIAITYITCDKLVDGICSGDNDECGCCTNTDCIIQENADKVEAEFVSCHIGEAIIPAISEQTRVE